MTLPLVYDESRVFFPIWNVHHASEHWKRKGRGVDGSQNRRGASISRSGRGCSTQEVLCDRHGQMESASVGGSWQAGRRAGGSVTKDGKLGPNRPWSAALGAWELGTRPIVPDLPPRRLPRVHPHEAFRCAPRSTGGGVSTFLQPYRIEKLPSTLESHRWRNRKKKKIENLRGPAQVLFWDRTLLHQPVSCFFSCQQRERGPAELGRRDWPSGDKPHEPGFGAPLRWPAFSVDGPSRQQRGQARYLLDQWCYKRYERRDNAAPIGRPI